MTIKNPARGDETILAILGERIARRRLDLSLTQAELAQQAGIGKRTVERLETGNSVQLLSLIRIFRVLGLADALEELLPRPGPRPMDLLRLQGKQRKRASSSHRAKARGEPWRWDDDS